MKLILAFLLGIACAMTLLAQPPAITGGEQMHVQIVHVVKDGAVAEVLEKQFQGSSLNKVPARKNTIVEHPPKVLIFITGAEGIADREKMWIVAKRDGAQKSGIITYEKWIFIKRIVGK